MFIVYFCVTSFAQTTTSTQSIQVEEGWNLLSLPVIVADGRKSSLFPTAISDAFIYENSYQPQDTLENGFGFWLKFGSSETIPITGDMILEDTIEVRTGWNIIGSLTALVAVSNIKSDPPDIITSQFFCYNQAGVYQETNIIQPSKGYWVKVNKNGSIILHTQVCPETPTVTYSGKTYNTVKIGNQCWLKENLNVGTMINGNQDQTDNSIIEKYCYGNNPANCNTYGGLYQWDEAMQYTTSEGSQGICPPHWHIPTNVEFETLKASVNNDGNALKAIGQGYGDGAGTDTSGFSALLAGGRNDNGFFSILGWFTHFWSSTEISTSNAYRMDLDSSGSSITLYSTEKDFGYSIRCLKNETNSPPSQPSNPIPTNNESNVYINTNLQWTCSDPDGDPLTYDVYFGTVNPPATKVSSNQTDTSLVRNGLTDGTQYFWKVVAKDNYGDSAVGPVWSFITQSGGGSPCVGIPTVTYGGKTYHTVQIGSQCWLKENLDVGTMIDSMQDQTHNLVTEKYCYRNDPSNCDTYGGLYQWDEAMQYTTTEGTKGICPTGWHIPTHSEFQILKTTVANDGNALKEVGQGNYAGAGTNTSGFSALLSGVRYIDGYFINLGYYADFLSSTTSFISHYHIELSAYSSLIDFRYNYHGFGFSVRCVKD